MGCYLAIKKNEGLTLPITWMKQSYEWWLSPVILTMQEVENGRIEVLSQPIPTTKSSYGDASLSFQLYGETNRRSWFRQAWV
jgi:hypothetical protein